MSVARTVDTLALVYHRTGDFSMALETQKSAISLLARDDRARAEYEARVADYLDALKEPPVERGTAASD